jgi:hypothetical protein
VTLELRYRPYAKETALCVDFAYSAMEADIQAELRVADGDARETLERLLQRLRARRGAVSKFTGMVADAAHRAANVRSPSQRR